MIHRFSNVVPTGTAVPEWAFLNISVSSHLVLNETQSNEQTLLALHSLKELGIPSWRTKLVVRPLDPVLIPCFFKN
jgi:hypothetical protein